MTTHWLTLTTRFGCDHHYPGMDDLRRAVDELYNENDTNVSQAAYEYHPDAWLRRGTENGPTIVVTINRQGCLRLEQWADPELLTPMAEPQYREDVSPEDALLLWCMLAAGDIPDLQAVFSREI